MPETEIEPIVQASNHATEVEMELTLDDGAVLSVGQLGGEFVILDTPINCSPCEGVITLSVDGRERSWRVALPDGAREGVVRTPILAV